MKFISRFRIFFLLTLLGNFCVGQEIAWKKYFGDEVSDYWTSVTKTIDGKIVVTGSIGFPNTGGGTGSDWVYIQKISSDGNVIWEEAFGGAFTDIGNYAKETPDGGYIVGATSRSNISGDKTENSNGLFDFWIFKLDSSRNIMWQNTIGGSNDDVLSSMEQTRDGGYILGGNSTSPISGDKSENCLGLSDLWVIKIDSVGNIEWENTIGGSRYDNLKTIQETKTGGFIIGGLSNSGISGDKTDSTGAIDYWVIKLDSLGNIQWQNSIGGTGQEELGSLAPTADGGYILSGTSDSDISGDKLENSIHTSSGSPTEDYWIVKIDSLGNIQWQNTIGGDRIDRLFSAVQTKDGGYILAGNSTSSQSADKTESQTYTGWSDFTPWVIKLDSIGNIVWQNTIEGPIEYSWLNSIVENKPGEYSVVGNFEVPFYGDLNCLILNLTENYSSITGKLYLDLNSNSIQDTLEPSVSNRIVQESTSGRITFSQQNGSYHLGVLDTGFFAVTPAVLNYFSAVPVSQSATFTSLHQMDSLNNFAYQPVGVVNDLCITLNGFSTLRPGFNSSFIIAYQNNGNTVLNATVILNLDSNTTLLTSSVPPDTIIGNSVIWYVGNLNPFQNGTISGTVNVSSTTPIGTLIIPTVRIEPIIGDVYTPCNYDSWTVAVTGSFDPNEILVDEDTLFTTQLSNAPYLEYVINFQNTGNDTAFTVKVLNPIDTNFLDLSSWEFINSSHPVSIVWKSWEKNFEFVFSNILLADSNVNEAASHGFVRYRIKPKSHLSTADVITNKAYIYFDFNFPIATNTAVTSIVLPTEITEVNFQKNRFAVVPHPLMDVSVLKFNNPQNDKIQFTLLDITGRILENSFTSGSKIILEKGNKSAGVYFFELLNARTNEKLNGKIMVGE